MAFTFTDTIARISTVTGIDATTTGSTTLFQVPATRTFFPTKVVIFTTSFTVGSKSVQAVASFGGNSATFDDYINSKTYTIAASGVFIPDSSPADTAVVVQSADDLFSIIIETASDATTEVWTVDLFGYVK